MKKYRFFVEILFVVLTFVLVPNDTQAALWEVPTGLNPGDTFRWVFVTSLGTTASKPDIIYYDDFINNIVLSPQGSTTLAGIEGKGFLSEVQWKAIAVSLYNPALIDNIGASYGGIYLVDGTLVAHHTMALFGEPLIHSIDKDENGNVWEDPLHRSDRFAWTGLNTDPWSYPVEALGSDSSTVGIVGFPIPSYWYSSPSTRATTEAFSMYAISEELTVVPVPGALILTATGLMSATVGLKRLCRKDQE